MSAPCDSASVERRSAKDEWRAQVRCFWTWPWGHCWHANGGWMAVKCCRCGADNFSDHVWGPVSSGLDDPDERQSGGGR